MENGEWSGFIPEVGVSVKAVPLQSRSRINLKQCPVDSWMSSVWGSFVDV